MSLLGIARRARLDVICGLGGAFQELSGRSERAAPRARWLGPHLGLWECCAEPVLYMGTRSWVRGGFDECGNSTRNTDCATAVIPVSD